MNKKLNIKEEPLIKKLNEQMEIIKNKFRDNYITLKLEIKKNDIGKDITIINQCFTYKLFKNIELDDIEVEINGELIPIKYKDNSQYYECAYYKYLYEDRNYYLFTFPL